MNINKLTIISAYYDSKDVLDIVKNKIINNSLSIDINNSLFGDPNIGKNKFFKIKYKINDEEFYKELLEGDTFVVINNINISEKIDIWIPTFRFDIAEECRKSILPYESKIYDGTNYESFSKLINECIINSENETIIVISDKVRANPEDIDKILNLLNQGYGIVGLSRFAFIGFRKDFIRKVGFFDERYLGGGQEDQDIILRTKEHNIAHYMSEDVYRIPMHTSWDYADFNSEAWQFYGKKWKVLLNSIIKTIPEEKYNYNLGDYKSTFFLPFKESVMYHSYCNNKCITADFIRKYWHID